MVSGLRLALVQVWATATIAALVAGPGLGTLITEGFYRTDYPKGIAAAIVVAVVAFVLELVGALAERAVEPNRQGTAIRSTAHPKGVARPDHRWGMMGPPALARTGAPDTRADAARDTEGEIQCRHASPRRGGGAVSAAAPRGLRQLRQQHRDRRRHGRLDARLADKGTVAHLGTELHRGRDRRRHVRRRAAEGRLHPQVKLVGTRDIYMKMFPKSVDVVPEYVGGIVEFLNGTYNGSRRQADHGLRPAAVDRQGPAAAGEGRASRCSTRRRRPTPTRSSSPRSTPTQNSVTTLSDLKGKSVVLAAAPDCKGRLDCEGGLTRRTASTSPRSCRWATPASRPTSR